MACRHADAGLKVPGFLTFAGMGISALAIFPSLESACGMTEDAAQKLTDAEKPIPTRANLRKRALANRFF